MSAFQRAVTAASAVAVLATTACSTQSRVPAGDSTGQQAGSTPGTVPAGAVADSSSARSKMSQLEADAKSLAKSTGCNSATACRTAPVGEKACGGPREYIAYCAATTDSVALFRKLDELRAGEIEFNKASNAMSTCEFRTPPKTTLVGGSCRAVDAP